MAKYSIGFSKAAVTAAGAIVDLATAASDRARLLEIGFTVGAMTGTTPVLSVGLSRTTAIGTRTTPTILLAEDAADPAATAGMASAWSVAPTIAATPLRRLDVNAIGAGMVWTFAFGDFLIPVSSSIVLHAIAVAGTTPSFTINGWIKIDE